MSVAGACVRGVRVAFSKKKAGSLLLPACEPAHHWPTGEPARMHSFWSALTRRYCVLAAAHIGGLRAAGCGLQRCGVGGSGSLQGLRCTRYLGTKKLRFRSGTRRTVSTPYVHPGGVTERAQAATGVHLHSTTPSQDASDGWPAPTLTARRHTLGIPVLRMTFRDEAGRPLRGTEYKQIKGKTTREHSSLRTSKVPDGPMPSGILPTQTCISPARGTSPDVAAKSPRLRPGKGGAELIAPRRCAQ